MVKFKFHLFLVKLSWLHTTLPRLELCAAVLGVEITKLVIKELLTKALLRYLLLWQ